MVVPRQLDITSAGDMLGQVSTRRYIDSRIANPVHYQCGEVDCRQNAADVDFAVHVHEGLHRRRAGAKPLETRPPFEKCDVFSKARCKAWHEPSGSPQFLDLLEIIGKPLGK